MQRAYRLLAVVAISVVVGCGKDAEVADAGDASLVVRLHVEKGKEPETMERAVQLLVQAMTQDSRNQFARLEEQELLAYDAGLGRLIRREFGLWRGNSNLLAATGSHHPDDASFVIIHKAWEQLRAQR